jgi:hypothetical protein
MQRPSSAAVVAAVVVALASAVLLAGQPSPPATPAALVPGPDAVGASSPPSGLVPGARSPRNANYEIQARLDPTARTITGREIITWRNITAATTSELRVHVYWNAWRNSDSTWFRGRRLGGGPSQRRSRPAADWGHSTLRAVRLRRGDASVADLTAQVRFIAPDDGNAADRTLASVPLPAPAAPGDTVQIEIEWAAQVPRTFARTGGIGQYFFLAQWFPKIAVLEDAGWNSHQFHGGTEFFSDYGVYDVRLRVPSGWIVGASGLVRGVEDHGDGTSTHRYVQEDVHDFAWTTSPDYQVLTRRFEHATLPPVDMRLLLQPEHAALADRHFDATAAALRYYGEWFGAYPYGHVTVVDPAWQSGAGGMEYPTLFTAGTRWWAPRGVTSPEGVTVHEAGHQFWYGIVGNNEFEHAWLDEGLNTFSTARAIEAAGFENLYTERFFGGFVPWVFRDIRQTRETDGNGMGGYRGAAESDAQATPSWQYFPATGSRITYSKTALWLHTLERHLGWPVLQRIMATFFERWRFRHPKPEDFFAIADEVSGQDLTWFFDEVYRSSNVFDYGVESLQSAPRATRGWVEGSGGLTFSDAAPGDGPYETTVVVRRFGEAVFPVDVLVRFADGTEVRERWDGRGRWKPYTYTRPAKAVSAVVDPGRVLLLDVNTTNNSRTLAPEAGPAAKKWSLRWMVWLQDLLMTYGFFV